MLQVENILNDTIAVTTSKIIDLQNMDGLCVSATYSNGTLGAKTFDSGVKALVAIEDLTFTAATVGTGGNSITVRYTPGATAGAEVVTVLVNAITVQIETTVSTATQIKTAYDLVAAATALAACSVTGTGSDAQVTTAATPLVGGLAAELDVDANTITIPTHGLVTGVKGQLTTTGTLPTGLSLATDYFVIKVDASTIKFATSLANAVAGTAVNITADGTASAVHTFTSTTSTSNVLKLMAGNDGTNFEDISGKTVTISTTSGATTVWDLGTTVRYRYVKVLFTPSAGQIAVSVHASYNLRA